MENRATNNDINSAAVDPITPHDHDVFFGRGGRANSYIGNLNYRELVERLKLFYFANPKTHKRYVAQSIVMAIASQDPPGRFLRKDPGTDQWIVVTEEEAIRKTQQALRENPIKQRTNTTHKSDHELNDGNISAVSSNSVSKNVVLPEKGTTLSSLEYVETDFSDIDRKLLKESLQVLLDDLEDPMETVSNVGESNDNV